MNRSTRDKEDTILTVESNGISAESTGLLSGKKSLVLSDFKQSPELVAISMGEQKLCGTVSA